MGLALWLSPHHLLNAANGQDPSPPPDAVKPNAEELEGPFQAPQDGRDSVNPWPAQFSWPVNASETQWEIEIYDLYANGSAPASISAGIPAGMKPDIVRQGPSDDMEVLPAMGFLPSRTSLSINLRPSATYLWRTRSKRNGTSSSKKGIFALVRKSSARAVGNQWSDWSPVHFFDTDDKETKLLSPGAPYGAPHNGPVTNPEAAEKVSQSPASPQPDAGVGGGVYPWGAAFKYEAVKGATGYLIEVSESGFADNEAGPSPHAVLARVMPSSDPNQATILTTFNLKKNHDYYWRVSARGPKMEYQPGNHPQLQVANQVVKTYVSSQDASYSWGDFSNGNRGSKFATRSPTVTDLVSPPPDSNILKWKAADNADSYLVQYTMENAAKESGVQVASPTNSYAISTVPEDWFGIDRHIVWTVTPQGPALYDSPQGEPGKPSAPASFSMPTPDVPELINPINHVAVSPGSVKFEWDAPSDTVAFSAPFGWRLHVVTVPPSNFEINAKLGPGHVPSASYPVPADKDFDWTVYQMLASDFPGPGVPGKGPSQHGYFTTKAITPCDSLQVAGTNVKDERVISLGNTTDGTFTMHYTTYGVPDKIEIFYEGKRIWTPPSPSPVADGCIGTGEKCSNANLSATDANCPSVIPVFQDSEEIPFHGTSHLVTVRVTPNCLVGNTSPDTEWQYRLNCPAQN